jgi:hypothetical protein
MNSGGGVSHMQPKRYIVWSVKDIDPTSSFQSKWYVQQVLTYGRAEDVASLHWDEVKRLLPELQLPPHVRRVWENYFASER